MRAVNHIVSQPAFAAQREMHHRTKRKRRRGTILRCFGALLYGTWILCYLHLTLTFSYVSSPSRILHPFERQQLVSKELDVSKPGGCDVPPEPHTSSSRRNLVDDSSVLVIATVPYDEDHVRALWSQLECFTDGIDVVVLSAPLGSEAIMEPFRDQVLRVLLHLNDVTVHYFRNDRYDVGLWCDALSALGYSNTTDSVPFNNTLLLNDSVFAMRRFGGILDTLRTHRDKQMVGLSYSFTHGYWIESVFRGFARGGILPFMAHSCSRGPSDRSFGPRYLAQYKKKRAIVTHHEIPLARQYPTNSTMGLFPSDPPGDWPEKYKLGQISTWVQNESLWRYLKDELFFPVAKVNQDYARACGDSVCTSRLTNSFLGSIDFGEFPRERAALSVL